MGAILRTSPGSRRRGAFATGAHHRAGARSSLGAIVPEAL